MRAVEIFESSLPLGECFTHAFTDYLKRRAEDEDVALVHAKVTMFDSKPYWHAWVEDTERVYDWQTMVVGLSNYAHQGWPKDDFYEFFKPKDIRRYTGPVGQLRKRFKHCGPWNTGDSDDD